jgi:hypothetical protein
MKTIIEEYYTVMYEGFDPQGRGHRIKHCTCYRTEAEADKALCEAMNEAEEAGWTGLQGDIEYHER